jgi:hypothetical protein
MLCGRAGADGVVGDQLDVGAMSRRVKTLLVLGFELCLVAAMAGSLVYFVRESRDFLADRPVVATTR